MTATRVVLAGTPDGALHFARVARGGYETACWHRIAAKNLTQLRETRAEISRARQLEWICADCESLLARGAEAFRRATGW